MPFPFFFNPPPSPQAQERAARWEAERIEHVKHTAIPWDPKGWKRNWAIQAATYTPGINLFPRLKSILPQDWRNADELNKKTAKSPSGKFIYVNQLVPAFTKLNCFRGSVHGTVAFDGPVIVPALFELDAYRNIPISPWMSLTPQEIVTLAPGTKIAKGHTIIVGLGLGYQLIEVSKKKSVHTITLVERNAELVKWLLPRIRKHMGPVKLNVVISGAWTVTDKIYHLSWDPYWHRYVLPSKFTRITTPKSSCVLLDLVSQYGVDVVLVDTFPNYGNNDIEDYIPEAIRPPGVKWWIWGSAKIGAV